MAHQSAVDDLTRFVASVGAVAPKMTEQRFRTMCVEHDLTYRQSDELRDLIRGSDSYAEIVAAARALPREVAVRIWNEVVDTKLRFMIDRERYYWRAESESAPLTGAGRE